MESEIVPTYRMYLAAGPRPSVLYVRRRECLAQVAGTRFRGAGQQLTGRGRKLSQLTCGGPLPVGAWQALGAAAIVSQS